MMARGQELHLTLSLPSSQIIKPFLISRTPVLSVTSRLNTKKAMKECLMKSNSLSMTWSTKLHLSAI